MLSDDERSASVLDALIGVAGEAGGWGILPPDAPPEDLAAAVAAVHRGLTVLSGDLAGRLLKGPVVAVDEADEPAETLTAREREVLGLLGRGLSNKQIGRGLYISEHTVKFHVSGIYAKLGVTNRAEAVSQAARRGLISL